MESVVRFFLLTDLKRVCQTGMVIFIVLQLMGLVTFYNYMMITGKSVSHLSVQYGNVGDRSSQGFKLKPDVVPPRLDSNPVYSIRIADERRILESVERSFQRCNNQEQETQKDDKKKTGRKFKTNKNVIKKHVVKVATTKVGKKLPDSKPEYPIFYRDKDLNRVPPISTQDGPIPHIIHQTWKNYNIPFKFQELVGSWAKKHPRWQYWFWTDQDADAFMRKRFPQYHRLFTSYRKPILKADAIRYFILYEFGGVYADLDMEALRSIDMFTKKHYCFIASEPFIHAAFFGNGMEYIACNALMGAVPKHSFFKMIIDNLADRFRKQKYILAQTGPKMVTDILNIYRNRTKYNVEDTIYLADPKHFMPQPADDIAKQIQDWCKIGQIIITKANLTRKQKNLCVSLKINKRKSLLQSVLPNDTYTVHKWMHTYHREFQIDRHRMQSIAMLIPHVSDVKKIIENMTQV